MPRYAHSGRARISTRHPKAMGESDRSGFWYPLHEMRRQYQWAGNKLVDTGLLVGPDEEDVPQDQYRSLILPPDPRPVPNPRPSPNVTGYGPIYGTAPMPYGVGDYGPDPYGQWQQFNPTGPTSPDNRGFTQLIVGGASQPPFYPRAKYDVLEAVAALTGIPIPPQIIDRSVTITAQNRSFPMFGTQPARGWMLIYNPTNPQAQVSLGPGTPPARASSITVSWGNRANLILGPGEAYFCSTDQGLGPCYQGGMAVIGLIPGMQFWAWESGYPNLWLTDDYGTLVTDEYGQAIPLDGYVPQPESYFLNANGLLQVINAYGWPQAQTPGPAVWNNASFAMVGPGSAPRFDAAPLVFGQVTPEELLILGGNDLPWDEPSLVGQLWNPGEVRGGHIWIAGMAPPEFFQNNGGVLTIVNQREWLTSTPPGPAIWSNGGVVSVGPVPAPPNPAAPPVFFGVITPTQLRRLGGANLPWTEPAAANQLWNPGGATGGDIWIAGGQRMVPRPFGMGSFGTYPYGMWPQS